MAAQVLAGLGVNGVSLGKRDLSEEELRGFFDELWNNALRPPIENALSGWFSFHCVNDRSISSRSRRCVDGCSSVGRTRC